MAPFHFSWILTQNWHFKIKLLNIREQIDKMSHESRTAIQTHWTQQIINGSCDCNKLFPPTLTPTPIPELLLLLPPHPLWLLDWWPDGFAKSYSRSYLTRWLFLLFTSSVFHSSSFCSLSFPAPFNQSFLDSSPNPHHCPYHFPSTTTWVTEVVYLPQLIGLKVSSPIPSQSAIIWYARGEFFLHTNTNTNMHTWTHFLHSL